MPAFVPPKGCLYFPAAIPLLGLRPWPLSCTYRPWSIILYLPAMAPNLCLPAMAPNLHSPALTYNLLPAQGLSFAYNDLVSSICIYIYSPGLRFVLPARGLNLHLPYYW